MILFVLMYSMSNVDQNKYSQLAASLSQSMGGGILNNGSSVLPGQNGILTGGSSEEMTDGNSDGSDATQATTAQAETTTSAITTTAVATTSSDQSSVEAVKNTLENMIKTNSLDGDIKLSITSVGLTITFPSTVFFDSGSATLNDSMKTALDKMAPEINTLPNDVSVKAYTDSNPISNSAYSSNWQLSSVRASNVVQYLQEQGNVNGARLSAVGCGDNNPVDTNDTEDGRNRNRRVEINILYSNSSTSQTTKTTK